MALYKWIVSAIVLLTFTSCSPPPKEPLSIAVNSWIGYTPIAYAQEKGWIEEKEIELKWTNSLSESKLLCKTDLVQGIFCTQYEIRSDPDMAECLLAFVTDISYGADKIVSNVSLETLKKAPKIKAYLEISGVNEDLLEAFLKKYKIKAEITKINGTQKEFLKIDRLPYPAIIVTYEPYASLLKKRGFHQISSSKELIEYLYIIDALFIESNSIDTKAIKKLQSAFWRAYDRFKQNPREFYETVKPYLQGQSFEDFIRSSKEILWVNRIDEKMLKYLHSQKIKILKNDVK